MLYKTFISYVFTTLISHFLKIVFLKLFMMTYYVYFVPFDFKGPRTIMTCNYYVLAIHNHAIGLSQDK
jgi:hypothetical protein